MPKNGGSLGVLVVDRMVFGQVRDRCLLMMYAIARKEYLCSRSSFMKRIAFHCIDIVYEAIHAIRRISEEAAVILHAISQLQALHLLMISMITKIC